MLYSISLGYIVEGCPLAASADAKLGPADVYDHKHLHSFRGGPRPMLHLALAQTQTQVHPTGSQVFRCYAGPCAPFASKGLQIAMLLKVGNGYLSLQG